MFLMENSIRLQAAHRLSQGLFKSVSAIPVQTTCIGQRTTDNERDSFSSRQKEK
jgi:hypothetical protein